MRLTSFNIYIVAQTKYNGIMFKSFKKWQVLFFVLSFILLISGFSFHRAEAAYTDEHDFDYTHGENPSYSSLIQGTDGYFYGTTPYGGAHNDGVIFQYDPSTRVYTDEYDFNDTDGSNPWGSLTLSPDGKTFYGLAQNGGVYTSGVIFQYDPSTKTYTDEYDFNYNNNGVSPVGSLILGSDGKFYGVTLNGGANSYGVIFQYNPTNNHCMDEYDFGDGNNNLNGADPFNSLVQGNDGYLYGMTVAGGANDISSGGDGVIFKFDPTTDTYTKEHDFDYSDGAYPTGSLTLGTDGNFYGMTDDGGTNSDGNIFEWNPTSNTFTDEHDFDYSDGAYPTGSLTLGTDGNFYGMTEYGGTNGAGNIFEWNPTTNTVTDEHDFDNTDGAYPNGSLTLGTDGNFYGMTHAGGANSVGVIFQWNTKSAPVASDVSITGTPNVGEQLTGTYTYSNTDSSPEGTSTFQWYSNGNPIPLATTKNYTVLSTDQGANITFGVAPVSEENVTGTLVQSSGTLINSFPTFSHIFTDKHSFGTGIDGAYPNGNLTLGSDGNFYSMTSNGGANSYGTIFEWNPTTNTFTDEHDFDNTDGAYPNGSLTLGTDGNFYGMTEQGGANGVGNIFQWNPTTNIVIDEHDFDNTDGSYPVGSLTLGTDGNFYGMTQEGGTNGLGNIFQWNSTTNIFTDEHDFNNTDGAYPDSSLTLGSDGNFYGMTSEGGLNGVGTIFQWNQTTNIVVDEHDFNNTDGADPQGYLTLGTDGNFYGMTYEGGVNGVGNIFEWNPSTNAFVDEHDFNNTDGAYPQGSLTLGSDDNFYGMTSSGGANGAGIIFQWNPTTNIFTDEHDFDNTDGNDPDNSLTLGSDDNFYGMTSEGGVNNVGVIFELSASVTISGATTIGQTLTGHYTYYDTDGDLEGVSTYQWYRNGTSIPGANSLTYILVNADAGTTIKLGVTPVALTGSSPGTEVQSSGIVIPAAGSISTSSTIVNTAINPTVTVTGTDFKAGITVSDLTVGVGTTDLTFSSVTYVSATEITLNFTGTSAAGDITIEANTTAFDPASASSSNTLTVTVPAAIPLPPTKVSVSSTSGSGITYGCKDPSASNYNPFSASEPSLCKYASATPTTITPTPTTTTTPSQILGSGKCSAALTVTENLKLGDQDHKYSTYNKGIVTQVILLQTHINRILAASYKQAAGPTDGYFGPLTRQGVKRLQKVLNTVLQPKPLLIIDGIVGPYTKAAINDSCGN